RPTGRIGYLLPSGLQRPEPRGPREYPQRVAGLTRVLPVDAGLSGGVLARCATARLRHKERDATPRWRPLPPGERRSARRAASGARDRQLAERVASVDEQAGVLGAGPCDPAQGQLTGLR